MTAAPGGLLVAVCGLEPGAGTTLLAGLLAGSERARRDESVVLLSSVGSDAELVSATAAQALVVADCGRLGSAAARIALGMATHVVWTVPAGAAAGETARALLLEGALAPPPGAAPELLAVVATRRKEIPPDGHRACRQVVAERGERLVYVPHVRGLAGGRVPRATPRRLTPAIAAIAALLRREPPP